MPELDPRYFDQSVARSPDFSDGGFVRPNLDPPVPAELSTGYLRRIGELSPASLRLLAAGIALSGTLAGFVSGLFLFNHASTIESADDGRQADVVDDPGIGPLGRVDGWSGPLGDGSEGAGVEIYGPDGQPRGWGRIVVGRSPRTGSRWIELGVSNDQAGMGDGTGVGTSLRVGVTGSGRPELHFDAHNRGSIPYFPDFDIGVGK